MVNGVKHLEMNRVQLCLKGLEIIKQYEESKKNNWIYCQCDKCDCNLSLWCDKACLCKCCKTSVTKGSSK